MPKITIIKIIHFTIDFLLAGFRKPGFLDASAQPEDHGAQGIAGLTIIFVCSVQTPDQFTSGNTLSSPADQQQQQMDHLGTQPFSQLDLLSLICHTKASEHLNINFIWLYFILSFHASHLSFSLILCSASSFTQIVRLIVHVLKGKSNANVK